VKKPGSIGGLEPPRPTGSFATGGAGRSIGAPAVSTIFSFSFFIFFQLSHYFALNFFFLILFIFQKTFVPYFIISQKNCTTVSQVCFLQKIIFRISLFLCLKNILS
jgi:hypothetical protein